MAMEKKLSLLQTVIAAGVFSSVSFWCLLHFIFILFVWGLPVMYGFMFGRESARKELAGLIDDLRRGNATPSEAAANAKSSHQ